MRCAASLVACLAAAACADNDLSGSVSEVFPLDISPTAITADSEALQVTYLYNRDVFLDIVARVSVATSDLTLTPGIKIPLQGALEGGVLRCVVAHAPGGEPVRLLPPIKRGDMVLDHGGRPGELTSGTFSVLFESEGGDLGYGRTLSGRFSGVAGDDHAATVKGATPLTIGNWGTAGEIQFKGDEDFFSFTAKAGALTLTLAVTGISTVVRLEKASLEPVTRADGGVTEPAIFFGPGVFRFTVPEPGDYILVVGEDPSGVFGAYTVRVLN
jgi:hypothetical protein